MRGIMGSTDPRELFGSLPPEMTVAEAAAVYESAREEGFPIGEDPTDLTDCLLELATW